MVKFNLKFNLNFLKILKKIIKFCCVFYFISFDYKLECKACFFYYS